MKRACLGCLVLGLTALNLACGSAASNSTPAATTHRGPITLRLKPGHYAFKLGGKVQAGDSIKCIAADGGAAGGGPVGKRGEGTNSSTGFSDMTSLSGVVSVTCPAHPNAM